jgi:hypothetical protein
MKLCSLEIDDHETVLLFAVDQIPWLGVTTKDMQLGSAVNALAALSCRCAALSFMMQCKSGRPAEPRNRKRTYTPQS